MDGKSFMKLAKDCKLLTKSCTPADIDLTFAKVGGWVVMIKPYKCILDLGMKP
jgi:hypothetical protein